MRRDEDSLTVAETQRQWLHRVMQEKGISAQEMADQAHVHVTTIHRALREEPALLGVPTLRKIAAAWDVAVSAELVPTVPTETLPIDPTLLRMALEDARHALRRIAGNSKYAEVEAELAAEILDSLLAAAREGRSVEEARKTSQGWIRHWLRHYSLR